MNHGDHRVAIGNCQRATGAEIILHVDDEEDVLGSDLHVYGALGVSHYL